VPTTPHETTGLGAGGDRTFSGLRALVDQARAGDQQALSTLFQLHEPMMLRWARKRLGQPLRTLDETRDVLHDCYQVVLRKIGAFEMEDSRSFARWLRGIITRVVLRKASSPHIARRTAVAEDYDAPDLDLTPMTRLSLDELKRCRYRILREFPRQDRLIYRLRVRGCTSSDIALRLGVTDRAVRMRFAKTDARLRLRMRQIVGAQPLA
jgi:RNA polymerase sigma factor (sigma-70 family)